MRWTLLLPLLLLAACRGEEPAQPAGPVDRGVMTTEDSAALYPWLTQPRDIDPSYIPEEGTAGATLQPDPTYEGTPLARRPFNLRTPVGWTAESEGLYQLDGERIELRPRSDPSSALIQITHVNRARTTSAPDLEQEIAVIEEMVRQSGGTYRVETLATAEAGSARGQERIYTLITDEGEFRHRVVYLASRTRAYAFGLLTRPEDADRFDRTFDSMLVTFGER